MVKYRVWNISDKLHVPHKCYMAHGRKYVAAHILLYNMYLLLRCDPWSSLPT